MSESPLGPQAIVATTVYDEKISPETIIPIQAEFFSQRTEPNVLMSNEKSVNLMSHDIGPRAIQNPNRLCFCESAKKAIARVAAHPTSKADLGRVELSTSHA